MRHSGRSTARSIVIWHGKIQIVDTLETLEPTTSLDVTTDQPQINRTLLLLVRPVILVAWNKPVNEKCLDCGFVGAEMKFSKTRGDFRKCLKCGNEWDAPKAPETELAEALAGCTGKLYLRASHLLGRRDGAARSTAADAR